MRRLNETHPGAAACYPATFVMPHEHELFRQVSQNR
jgi:hypothetical protein